MIALSGTVAAAAVARGRKRTMKLATPALDADGGGNPAPPPPPPRRPAAAPARPSAGEGAAESMLVALSSHLYTSPSDATHQVQIRSISVHM